MGDEQRLPGFGELGLSAPILEALAAVGYETPSPIQARTIPLLLSGADLLGQAQTGTGKTAAFALPMLAQIDLSRASPQALVLVPTRELAIQVAEAFQRYAAHLPGFHVLPIYGGQSYGPQLKGLKRGAHVIVGTPGRVMDHMKRGALKLDTVRFIVLDEGDEMLQMGFVDAIEWILEQAPPQRQIALFSATLPPAIRRIAQTAHARAGADHDPESRQHDAEDPPALLAGQRAAQAGCAHAGAGGGALRGHACIRPHEARDDGARRTARGARLQRCRVATATFPSSSANAR